MRLRPYYRCHLVAVADLVADEVVMTFETDKDGDRFTVTFGKSQATFIQARLTAALTPK